MHLLQGTTLAVIFMLAHVVEETDFPLPDNTGSIKNTWAVHQLYTTADFGRNNSLLNFFCGGLNFQVEHHFIQESVMYITKRFTILSFVTVIFIVTDVLIVIRNLIMK